MHKNCVMTTVMTQHKSLCCHDSAPLSRQSAGYSPVSQKTAARQRTDFLRRYSLSDALCLSVRTVLMSTATSIIRMGNYTHSFAKVNQNMKFCARQGAAQCKKVRCPGALAVGRIHPAKSILEKLQRWLHAAVSCHACSSASRKLICRSSACRCSSAARLTSSGL